jgi:CheY-like chemotaxis protein
VRLFLESHSFEVTCVTNGVDGLRKVMSHAFDVILCDLNMPNLPGDKFHLAVERARKQLCRRKESHATAGRNNSQSAQKDSPKLTAWRHETGSLNASGAAKSSTRPPHSPSAVATIATLRAMRLLPLVRFMSG